MKLGTSEQELRTWDSGRGTGGQGGESLIIKIRIEID